MTSANLGSPNLASTELEYPQHDVLTYTRQKIKRLADLLKAITLDGHAPTTVRLQIEAIDQCVLVQGRIVSVLDHKVRLNDGSAIPLGCIHRIEFP